MNPFIIGMCGLTLWVGVASAQLGADPAAAAIEVEAGDKAIANQAKSAVDRVFGAGQGASGAAPAAGAPNEAVPVEGAAAPADGGGGDGGQAVAGEVPDKGRDPFRPFTLDLRPEVTDNEVVTPLQRYELPQLRLAGVVLNLTTPRAMLQDNSGMGFIVTPGTPIGRRRGVVKSIEPRRVIVEEHVLDYYGREQVTLVAIEMPKDDKSANQE